MLLFFCRLIMRFGASIFNFFTISSSSYNRLLSCSLYHPINTELPSESQLNSSLESSNVSENQLALAMPYEGLQHSDTNELDSRSSLWCYSLRSVCWLDAHIDDSLFSRHQQARSSNWNNINGQDDSGLEELLLDHSGTLNTTLGLLPGQKNRTPL